MGLLKTILYAVIIYYIWNIVRTLFRSSAQSIPNTGNQHSKQRTTFDQTKQKPNPKNIDGDYVDYEEIK